MIPHIIRRKGDGVAFLVRLDDGASWVHPDCLGDALDALRPPNEGQLLPTPDPLVTAWYTLRDSVGLIEHIARHPAGTEAIVAQVRTYRRRIKAHQDGT